MARHLDARVVGDDGEEYEVKRTLIGRRQWAVKVV
jgi:hypothetical protein